MEKVLIANRGEIAVRVARGCHDAGDCLRRRLRRSGARARRTCGMPMRPLPSEAPSRPTRTFRARSSSTWPAIGCRRACIRDTASWPRTPTSPRRCVEAGLTWIGPPPKAIRDLGDKTVARRLASRSRRTPGPGAGRAGPRCVRHPLLRRRVRLPTPDQGCIRRRRPGHEGGPRYRRARSGLRVGRPGVDDGIRARRVLRRTLPGTRPASRDPVPRRSSKAMLSSSPPATARSRGGTRSWSRRLPPPSWPTTRSAVSMTPPRRSWPRPAT